MVTRWTCCEAYFKFHTKTSAVCEALLWQSLVSTLWNVCRCVHGFCEYILKLWPKIICRFWTHFHRKTWLLTVTLSINYQIYQLRCVQLADESLGVANLPAPTYQGGQVAGQMPSSSAPQWKISTFLTGHMSDTWQDCYQESPAECLQTDHSVPEIKVVFLFLSLFQTPCPVCLFSHGWFHF